jgi:hypothetical protein
VLIEEEMARELRRSRGWHQSMAIGQAGWEGEDSL